MTQLPTSVALGGLASRRIGEAQHRERQQRQMQQDAIRIAELQQRERMHNQSLAANASRQQQQQAAEIARMQMDAHLDAAAAERNAQRQDARADQQFQRQQDLVNLGHENAMARSEAEFAGRQQMGEAEFEREEFRTSLNDLYDYAIFESLNPAGQEQVEAIRNKVKAIEKARPRLTQRQYQQARQMVVQEVRGLADYAAEREAEPTIDEIIARDIGLFKDPVTGQKIPMIRDKDGELKIPRGYQTPQQSQSPTAPDQKLQLDLIKRREDLAFRLMERSAESDSPLDFESAMRQAAEVYQAPSTPLQAAASPMAGGGQVGGEIQTAFVREWLDAAEQVDHPHALLPRAAQVIANFEQQYGPLDQPEANQAPREAIEQVGRAIEIIHGSVRGPRPVPATKAELEAGATYDVKGADGRTYVSRWDGQQFIPLEVRN